MKKANRASRWGIGVIGAASVLGLVAYRGWAAPPEAIAASNVTPVGALSPVDVLVFAPHPDDEVLGCGGVVQQALAAGKAVRIVFSTQGDAYTQAAAALLRKGEESLGVEDYLNLGKARAQEALDADRALGVDADHVIFLGYPDGSFAQVATNVSSIPVTSPFTGRSSTYGALVPDYHTRAHGVSAPYVRASAVADFSEVLQQSHPSVVYVTDRVDAHPDHRATNEMVQAAIAGTGYRGIVRTFLVHSAGRPEEWPFPAGPTPLLAMQEHTKGDTTYPANLPWPPNERVTITNAQALIKLHALTEHRSQWALPSDKTLLGAFVKSEEIFWTGR